jgi:hypothetical protein
MATSIRERRNKEFVPGGLKLREDPTAEVQRIWNQLFGSQNAVIRIGTRAARDTALQQSLTHQLSIRESSLCILAPGRRMSGWRCSNSSFHFLMFETR